MSRPRSTVVGSVALGSVVAMPTGCTTSTPGTSTPDTSGRQTLSPGVTVEQLDAARDPVLKTHDDLIEASQDVAEDQVGAVRTAKDELIRAVEAVPDDGTLRQAVASPRDEAADVQAAVSNLQTEASC